MTGAPAVPTSTAPLAPVSAGTCEKCGYDMTGAPDPICPECGSVHPTPPPDNAVLGKHALRGSIWTLGGYGASQAFRLANSLILTRLLTPHDFGVMNIVNVVLQGLQMFSDVGIRPSIIQSKRGDDPVFLNTAWTMSAIRGVFLWFIACIAAWPVSLFFGEKILFYIIPVSGLTALFSGLISTSMATANRKFAFGRLTALDLGLQIVSTGSAIVWAYFWPTPWALVVGGLVNAIAGLIASHTLLPGIKHRFIWDRESAKALIKFGKWIFLSTAITFLARQSDRIVLGKLSSHTELGVSLLGVYGIAQMWSRLPAEVFEKLAMSVFFPIMSSSINSATFDPHAIKRMRMSLLLPVALGCGAVFVIAEPTIQIMYRQPYWAAGQILAVLAIGTWIGTISYTYGAVLLAAGRPKYISFGTAGKTALFLAAAFPLYAKYGVLGIAIAVSISELASLIPMVIGARTLKVANPAGELLLTGAGAGFAIGLYYLYHLLRDVTHNKIASVAAVMVITAVACLMCLRRLVKGMKAKA
jgi:O-antigen/teichoic acid export membrane protein